MIIYHATTTYLVLCAALDALAKNRNETKVLMVASWVKESMKNLDNVKDIFDSVYFYDQPLQKNYIEFFDNFFKNNEIDLSQSDIYVGGVQYYFGAYLSDKCIDFSVFEEACGIASNYEKLYEIDFKLNRERTEYVNGYGNYDLSNTRILKVFCNLSIQKPEKILDKFANFDIISLITQLDLSQKEILKKVFEVDELDNIEAGTLLLTQHFANLGILSFEQQVLIYQYLFDFFLNGVIAIKPHPNDFMYYSLLFPNSIMIKGKFPSEFLPFVLKTKPDIIATISSTAIYPLRNHFKSVLEFDDGFIREFEKLNKYYYALKIACIIGKKITFLGANKRIVENLVKFGGFSSLLADYREFIDNSFENTSDIIIIDNIAETNSTENAILFDKLLKPKSKKVLIFINNVINCIYDDNSDEIWNNTVPILISKEKLRDEDFYDNIEEEMLYLYTKNKEITNIVKNFKESKELPNIGESVSCSALSGEQMEIRILKGKLAATEKRLLYYINKEKNGEKDIKK